MTSAPPLFPATPAERGKRPRPEGEDEPALGLGDVDEPAGVRARGGVEAAVAEQLPKAEVVHRGIVALPGWGEERRAFSPRGGGAYTQRRGWGREDTFHLQSSIASGQSEASTEH